MVITFSVALPFLLMAMLQMVLQLLRNLYCAHVKHVKHVKQYALSVDEARGYLSLTTGILLRLDIVGSRCPHKPLN